MKKNLFLLFTLLSFCSSSTTVDASIFNNERRWPQNSSGRTVISVCIEKDSSVTERSRDQSWLTHGWLAQDGWRNSRNPSLDEVINRIRSALKKSWERTGSISFIGWQFCDSLTPEQQNNSIRFWIHPKADNKSLIGTSVRGKEKGTQIKPWGTGGLQTQCIRYNNGRNSMEYHFTCAEQFAIHEFGHALGFEHEWRHPLKPASCQKNEPLISFSDASQTYPTKKPYTIVNLNSYDLDSIMAYDNGCADVTGERFGSPNLSPIDKAGLKVIYP
jgi:hypothetical protein